MKPEAEQPDGRLHRGPYILISKPAAATNIHQQRHIQTHKVFGGVTCLKALSFLAAEVHASGQTTGLHLKITMFMPEH